MLKNRQYRYPQHKAYFGQSWPGTGISAWSEYTGNSCFRKLQKIPFVVNHRDGVTFANTNLKSKPAWLLCQLANSLVVYLLQTQVTSRSRALQSPKPFAIRIPSGILGCSFALSLINSWQRHGFALYLNWQFNQKEPRWSYGTWKREAGENPAQSRCCVNRDVLNISLR